MDPIVEEQPFEIEAPPSPRPEVSSKPYYSLHAKSAIKNTDEFNNITRSTRWIYVISLLFLLIFSPFVFRYALGSNVQNKKKEYKYLEYSNATLSIETKWSQCQPCMDSVTLREISVTADNVTAPLQGNTPSIAIFASQDFERWYSAYKPEFIADAYISSWQSNSFTLPNTTLSCLGTVYRTYLVVCLNTLNLATTLKLGESVQKAPFNNVCFQVAGICGIPCFQNTGPYPNQCQPDGIIDPMLLSSNDTKKYTTNKTTSHWATNLSAIEWLVLVVIFLDTFGIILRSLPFLAGRPTEMDSAQSCFVSGGRHSIEGAYIDLVLNEKRSDSKRFYYYIHWMDFLISLADMGASIDVPMDPAAYSDHQSEVGSDEEDELLSEVDQFEPRSSRWDARGRQSIGRGSMGNIGNPTPIGTANPILRISIDEHVSYSRVTSTQYHAKGSVSGVRVSFAGADRLSEMGRGRLRSNSGSKNSGTANPLLPSLQLPQQPQQPQQQQPAHLQRQGSIGNGTTKDSCSPRTSLPDVNMNSYSNMENRRTYSMAQLLPLIRLLDGWTEAVKELEGHYAYLDPADAIEHIFAACPLDLYYSDSHLISAHAKLKTLYNAFTSNAISIPTPPNEQYYDNQWTVTRIGLPDWTVIFGYYSRARVSAPKIYHPIPPDFNNGQVKLLEESTKLQRGAVVFKCKLKYRHPMEYIQARRHLYVVLSVERTNKGKYATIAPLRYTTMDALHDLVTERVDISSIQLLEQNRGKAGVLNVTREFLLHYTYYFNRLKYRLKKLQCLMGIIDARHMLVEPDLFYNSALPFFTADTAVQATPPVVIVQYPQYFSNVQEKDYLDNKNSAYYTIWQTLRDCAKATTSSGTNAIWDISTPNFVFATTSRIEDTGTSQLHIPRHHAVHLPLFVAFGIAKQTNDYLEAVYRWSTGAVELFWATISGSSATHYLLIALLASCYGAACFAPGMRGLYGWSIMLLLLLIKGLIDKSHGQRPLRRFVVSSIIVLNTTYYVSNLASIVWMIVIPISIAFYKHIPITSPSERALFWGFTAIFLRLPPAIMTDALIRMCRHLYHNTSNWNYSKVLWRSSQLYSCSFGYTFLSLVTGTYNSIRAHFFHHDLTSWSSFRVNSVEYAVLRNKMSDTRIFSLEMLYAILDYCYLLLRSLAAAFTMPDVVTKWYSLMLLGLQVACIAVSLLRTHQDDVGAIFVTVIVCGLNILLVIDIALLLSPSLGMLIGTPTRPEYMFGVIGVVLVFYALMSQSISLKDIERYLKLGK